MRRTISALVLVVLTLTALVASTAAQAPRALVVQTVTEPPGLDLTATPASATATVVLYNVQECLVKVDAHGKLVPWLAERWHTTDNRNYTFFLKKGVRFHNGRELKAADVKFVIERAMNPETKHPYPHYYAAIGDIIVKDDYTITFSLKSPSANFLLNLARQGSVIYPREAVDTLKSAPIGTGPFTLADWVRGDRIVLKRYAGYHVKGLPKLEQVTFRFIPDPNATLAALKAGDIDASLFGLGPEHVADIKKDGRFEVIVGETTNDVIMAMNNSRKPFTDARVRRAVTHAINKPDVVKLAMFGLGRVIGSNVDTLNPYFVDLANAMPYDPAKAKASGRGRLPGRVRGGAEGGAAVLLHGPRRRGDRGPTGQGRRQGQDRADRVGAVALARVEGSRLRSHDHRPCRSLGPRELRQSEILLSIRQREIPGALQEVRGHAGRQGTSRAVRAAPEDAGGGRTGGLPLHPSETGGSEEGRDRLVEGSPDPVRGYVRGRLVDGSVAAAHRRR